MGLCTVVLMYRCIVYTLGIEQLRVLTARGLPDNERAQPGEENAEYQEDGVHDGTGSRDGVLRVVRNGVNPGH